MLCGLFRSGRDYRAIGIRLLHALFISSKAVVHVFVTTSPPTCLADDVVCFGSWILLFFLLNVRLSFVCPTNLVPQLVRLDVCPYYCWVHEKDAVILRLDSKRYFLMKLVVRLGSGDPERSLIYAAVVSDCCSASCDALSAASPLPTCLYTTAACHSVFVLSSLVCVCTVSPCAAPPWACFRLLTVKGRFFFSFFGFCSHHCKVLTQRVSLDCWVLP